MKVNLFINFYTDKNAARQEELETCVLANILNTQIDTINIIIAKNDLAGLLKIKKQVSKVLNDKIKVINFETRPTYNNYFKFTEKYPNDINIIANKDMIMDAESIKKLEIFNLETCCLALSRWDFINDNLNTKEAVHFNRPDSQDTWIVKGAFKQLPLANFGLGVAGCDNKIALLLSDYYDVINPSLTIKTYHYHITNVRNYTSGHGIAVERIPPPYKLVMPTY